MDTKESKQFITDLATSPGFMHALIAYSKTTEGRQPSLSEVGLWFYSSGYLHCLDFQKKTRINRPYKTELREELKKVKNK